MRAASGMSRSIDSRRPRCLSDRQLAEVKRHPEVKLYFRTRNALAKQIRARHGTISRTKGTGINELYVRAHRRHQNKKKAELQSKTFQVRFCSVGNGYPATTSHAIDERVWRRHRGGSERRR